MATRTTNKDTTAVVEEYDFDGWSEEAEEKAIAALAPDIRYIIVEKRFIGRFPDGTVVEMPLKMSLDDVDALDDGTAGPVDQFRTLLTNIGGEKAAREFSSHDLAETAVMAEKFFRVLTKITQASLPE